MKDLTPVLKGLLIFGFILIGGVEKVDQMGGDAR